jgi:hypothetical protein
MSYNKMDCRERWIRTDTGEIAKEGVISEEELQEEMELGSE